MSPASSPGAGPPLGGGGSGGGPVIPPGPHPPPSAQKDGDPYRIAFEKEWTTTQRGSLFAAAQEFFRAWHPLRGNMRLKGRRPREIEIRVVLNTGDVLRLYFSGKKTIDELLSGRHELLEQQLKRAGVDSSLIRSGRQGGAMQSVQIAVSGLDPLSQERRDAGEKSNLRTGVRGRIAEISRHIREEEALPEKERDAAKLVLMKAELDALQKLPKTNKEAMARFERDSIYASEKRLRDLGPRGAFEAAVKLAAEGRTGVEIKVEGARIPVRPQVAQGDSARVQRVHRKQQDADVDVLRSRATGRFVSAIPDAAKLRILDQAEQQGFSKVARETGIKRTTIYEWRKLRDEGE